MNSGANGKIFIEKDPPSEASNTQTFRQRIIDYLAYLKEQLNFIFSNYGRRLVDAADNVNELTRTATETTSRISNAEGDISTLQQTAQGLTSTVSDLSGNVTALQETATGLTSQVSTLGGRVSTVEQTASGLTSRVSTAEGNISTLTQTANGLSVAVESTAEKLSNIGGRNLIINTLNPVASPTADRPKILGQGGNTVVGGGGAVAEHGIRSVSTTPAQTYIRFGPTTGSMNGLTAGQTYTLSADINWKLLSNYSGSTAYYLRAGLRDDRTGTVATQAYVDIAIVSTVKTGTERLVFTFTVGETATSAYIWIYCNDTTGSDYATTDFLEAANIKLETGEVATAWAPAPEDLEGYADKTAKAQIDVAAEEITSTVSQTYQTKADASVVNLIPSLYRREYQSGNPVTLNGITWTVNPDGSITAEGTASANSDYYLAGRSGTEAVPWITLDTTKAYSYNGNPVVTGCQYRIGWWDENGTYTGTNYLENDSYSTKAAGQGYACPYCRIVSGTALPTGGVTFKPMLEVGTTAHGYVSTHGGSYAMQSQIVQNATSISSKVSKESYNGETIASLINQSADTVQIEAQHINLVGAVTISSLDSTAQAALLSNTTVKTQYYLSTSASSATGGTWYDSPNSITWAANRYVWTRVATTKTKASGASTTTYSTAVYDKQLTTALSNAASAATAAGNAQTTANGTVKEAIPIYYRSMSSTTPTLTPGETYVYVTDNTDDQWSAVAPRPKKNAYFWEAVRYTLGDNSRAYSPVRALTSEQYASKWVSNADSAYIDGGSIYANTVTADKINVSDLSALNATIGGWSIGSNEISKTWSGSLLSHKAGISAPATPDNTSAAFYVSATVGGATTYPFRVNYDGKLIATSAEIEGTITSSNATITGGSININTASSSESKITLNYTPSSGTSYINDSSAISNKLVSFGSLRTMYGSQSATYLQLDVENPSTGLPKSTVYLTSSGLSSDYIAIGTLELYAVARNTYDSTTNIKLNPTSGITLAYGNNIATLTNNALHFTNGTKTYDFDTANGLFMYAGANKYSSLIWPDSAGAGRLILGDGTSTKWRTELTNSGLVFRNARDAVTASYEADRASKVVNVTGSYVSVASATTGMTNLCSVTLEVGLWVILCSIRFVTNANGYRFGVLSTSSGGAGGISHGAINIVRAVDGNGTYISFPAYVNVSSSTTYYLNCRQNSGSAVSTTGYIDAIKIA